MHDPGSGLDLFMCEPVQNLGSHMLALPAVADFQRHRIAQGLGRALIAQRLGGDPQQLGKLLVAQVRPRWQVFVQACANAGKRDQACKWRNCTRSRDRIRVTRTELGDDVLKHKMTPKWKNE